MPEEVIVSTVSEVQFIEDPQNAEPSARRSYDENTLEERIDYILLEHPEKASRATESQPDFRSLVRKIFNGREGRWPTPQIQVELSRRLAEPTTLNTFR